MSPGKWNSCPVFLRLSILSKESQNLLWTPLQKMLWWFGFFFPLLIRILWIIVVRLLPPYFSSSPLNNSSKRSNNLLNVWILFVLYVVTHTHTHLCLFVSNASYESNINYNRHTVFPCYPTPYLVTKLLTTLTLCQDTVTDHSMERENPSS